MSTIAKGKYQEWLEPDGLILIKGWARNGLTEKQISHNMGINEGTLNVWKKKYPTLREALKHSKEIADFEIENALYQRALGMTVTETRRSIKIVQGIPVEDVDIIEKQLPPDSTSMIFWLKNRKRETWENNPRTKADIKEQEERIKKLQADIALKTEETKALAGAVFIPKILWQDLMNDAYAEHLDNNRPTQIFFGGSSSGKSFAILGQRTIYDVMQGKRNYLICRKTARTLRNSSFNEIKKCIARMGLDTEFSINKTDMIVTHKTSGRQILFAGLDDVEKIKSITPANGVLTDIVIEEATEISYNDYKSLIKRLRGGEDNTIKRTTMLFNPVLKDHWIYKEFFTGKWDENKNYYEDDNLSILKTIYKDNRHLTEDDRQKLENESDQYYYNVYTLGNWGVLGNIIFTNYEVTDTREYKKKCTNVFNGLDFGFYPDPCAFIQVGFNRAKEEIYVWTIDGGNRLTNNVLAERIRPIINNGYVTCDSAEPKSIQELNNYGVRAIGAIKGQGSVKFGIKWLQRHKIFIDPRCVELISEMQKYKYREDKNGNVLPEPVDRDNHWIDALRYALESEMVETRVR